MNRKEIEQIQSYALKQARDLISLLSNNRSTFTVKQTENLNYAMVISRYVISNTTEYLKLGQEIIEAREKELDALLTMVTDIITNPSDNISLNNLPTDLQTELRKQFLTEEEETSTPIWDFFSNLFSLCQNAKIADIETVYGPYIEKGSADIADTSTTALEVTGITQQDIP